MCVWRPFGRPRRPTHFHDSCCRQAMGTSYHTARMAKERKSDGATEHLRLVRRICAAMPETTEKLSHGEPTFFVRKKVFAMFANHHHKRRTHLGVDPGG